MSELSALKVGCGKFFYGKNVLSQLPGEILRLGGKALIVGGEHALSSFNLIAGNMLSASNFELITHHDQCTKEKAEYYSKKALNEGFTVLVGIGGGRCLDNVKCASVFSGLPVITVPTSIATCVATSMTCIMYNDKGQREPAVNLKKEVDVCIADMDLIATAPRRLLASGIMDSLAKYPESFHQLNISSYRDCQLKEYIQVITAKIIYDFLLGEYTDLYSQGNQASHFKDVILTNLLHTSIVSGFADGSGQLAIAHATYDFMRNYHTEEGQNFLHGEIVAVGLLVQMAFNQMEQSEIERVRNAMRYMNMPLTLQDLGYPTSKENLDFFLSVIAKNTNIHSHEDLMKLSKSMQLIL